MTDERTAQSGGPVQASLDDLERGALQHYEEVSAKSHSWMNVIPKAIKAYYAAQRSETAPKDQRSGMQAMLERSADVISGRAEAQRCVAAPKIVHRPDFHCPTCNLGYFGPHWEQVDGKWKHVGRACKGTPSGYDRSYFACKAKYVDYFEEERTHERNGE